ncbi:conserved hypothetical protein [Burkholderia mallei JHU]|nr:conserved hypothetical protein [Burkholderia mallei FMH]EDK61944.1 conserved hypothetical protein [Burkholderia mallei JHU]
MADIAHRVASAAAHPTTRCRARARAKPPARGECRRADSRDRVSPDNGRMMRDINRRTPAACPAILRDFPPPCAAAHARASRAAARTRTAASPTKQCGEVPLSKRHDELTGWRTGMCDVRCAMCDVRCAMCDVRCAMCDVRCAMCDGRWAMCDGRWAMCDVRCAMCDVRWAMGDGRWAMGDGRWAMGDGRWRDAGTASPHARRPDARVRPRPLARVTRRRPCAAP